MELSADGLTLKLPSSLSLLELTSYMETIGCSLTWVSRHDILFIHPLPITPLHLCFCFRKVLGRSERFLFEAKVLRRSFPQSAPMSYCQVLQ